MVSRARPDRQVFLEVQDLTDSQEVKELLAHQANEVKQDQQGLPGQRDLRVCAANQVYVESQVHQAKLVLPASVVIQDYLDKEVKQAHKDPLDHKDLVVKSDQLGLKVLVDRMDHLVRQARLELVVREDHKDRKDRLVTLDLKDKQEHAENQGRQELMVAMARQVSQPLVAKQDSIPNSVEL